MRRLRPAGTTASFWSLVGVTTAMHVISRTTGSGWLVVVVSSLLGVIGLSAILPVLTLARTPLTVTGPTDATAGRPVSLTVTVGGRPRGAKLRLLHPTSDWVRIEQPGSGSIVAVPGRRGVLRVVDVELRSSAPFGLVWWRLRQRAALERPLEVGPAPLDTPPPEPAGGEASSAGEASAGPALTPELPRGVRDYVPGDPPRLVSWVATARHGRLMVKELEAGTRSPQLTLVVDLRGDKGAAEEAASRAAGMAISALRRGSEVVLSTAEPDGPHIGPVASVVEVGRRLARATSDGPPAAPSTGGWVEVVAGAAR